MTELTDIDKQILAFALFGFVMRAGPGQFARILLLAEKLGISQEFTDQANDWLTTS
jgi:hypothetical protein